MKFNPSLELIEVGDRVINFHRQEIVGTVFSDMEGHYRPWWNAINVHPETTLAGALLAVVEQEEAS